MPARAADSCTSADIQAPTLGFRQIRQLDPALPSMSCVRVLRANVAPFLVQSTRRFCRSASTRGVQPALFNIAYLRSPDDFVTAARVAMEVCDPLVEEIIRDGDAVGVHTLHKLDVISDTICKVLDAAECTRNVSASEAWRDAADSTFQSLAAYMYRLNANVPLYRALVALTGNAERLARLSEEQRRMGLLLRREFERDGIHLDGSARGALVGLNNEASSLASEFMGRAHAEATPFVIRTDAAAARACLPTFLRAQLPPKTFAEKVAGAAASTVTLTTDPLAIEYLLRLCPSRSVREAVLRAANADAHDNIAIIHRLVAVRAHTASIIGFDSYAALVASDRLAGDPTRVISFLRTLGKALLPRMALELAELSAAAAAAAASSGTATEVAPSEASDAPALRVLAGRITKSFGGPVALWDVPYLARAVSAATYWGERRAVTGTGPAPDPVSAEASVVSAYLPFSAALDGLALIMSRVFGVTCVRMPLSPGEGWDAEGSSSNQGASGSAHPKLIKLVLRHEAEGALGTLFLDPFSRPGKFGGAAHFVVRCGKRLHAGDGAFEKAMGVPLNSPSVSTTEGAAGSAAQRVQLPIITLVTNMSMPEDAAGAVDPFSSILLTPGELETLFHEFGHALHSLLSRTEFQHLSGTRGALDFVELPSHVFEYWARDERSVSAFARHHITGASMPQGLWARVQAVRGHFLGAELSSSLANALFDQALHGSPTAVESILHGPDVSAEQVEHIAAAAVAAVRGTEGGSVAVPRPAPYTLAPAGYLPSSELAIPLAGPDTLRPMPSAGSGGAQAGGRVVEMAPGASTSLYAAVASSYTLPDLPSQGAPGTPPFAWHARFTHLASYGGGYYTYLYAAAFSADVWAALFAADPFSRSAGEVYRTVVLSRGAAADPCAMLTSVLGRPPSLAPLLTELGLLPPAGPKVTL